MNMRRAVPGTDDVACLFESEQRAFGDKSFTIWAVEPLCRHGVAFLFEINGHTIGHALLMKEWDTPSTAYLASYAIDQAERGRGLGRRALHLLLDELRRQDVSRVELTVDPANKAACSLYKSEGFEIRDTVTGQYGPDEDRYIMTAVLQPK